MKENIILKVDEKGRLTLPLKMRKDFDIKSGDVFFVKPEKTGIYLAKAEYPFDILARHAIQESKAGNTITLEEFEQKIKKSQKKK